MVTGQPVGGLGVRSASTRGGVKHVRKRSATGQPPQRRRGRPRGIDREREQTLSKLATAGLTLAQMADALGVSRQCVHQQLQKCPEISIERRARRAVRHRIESNLKLREAGLQWIERRASGGPKLT